MLSPPPHFGGCPAARQLCFPLTPLHPVPPPSILLACCLSQHAGAAWGPTFLLRLGFESAHSLGAPALHCQVGVGGGGWQLCIPYASMGPVGQQRSGAAEDGLTHCTWVLLSPRTVPPPLGTTLPALAPRGSASSSPHCPLHFPAEGLPFRTPPPPKIRAGCCLPHPTFGVVRAVHHCGVGGRGEL